MLYPEVFKQIIITQLRASKLLLVVFSFLPLEVLANERLPGGSTTTEKMGANAFSMPSANMSLTRRLDFSVGNSFFRNPWVIAPSITDARDGLGPLFNTNSCQSCHIKDARGHAPSGPDDSADSMLVKLAVPTADETIGKNSSSLSESLAGADALAGTGALLGSGAQSPSDGHPVYGRQIQDRAIPGIKPEARVRVTWSTKIIRFTDGSTYSLRVPNISLTDLKYGPLGDDIILSSRVAPAMIGLGLLEAIDEKDIRLKEDEFDQDGDGISGRANLVWDISTNQYVLGRFGWKASQPSLEQQNAAAFSGDLGLTSRLFPNSTCTEHQEACLSAPNGGALEVSDKVLSSVTFYSRNLAVPARGDIDQPSIKAGKALFTSVGCDSCHTPSYITPPSSQHPEQAGQTIWPYTDMLLHDMGDELADGQNEFLANGNEWRTPPLWGLHALEGVNGHTNLMHDGRARNVLEAILWHGGEAQKAQQNFISLPKDDRAALVSFVESL